MTTKAERHADDVARFDALLTDAATIIDTKWLRFNVADKQLPEVFDALDVCVLLKAIAGIYMSLGVGPRRNAELERTVRQRLAALAKQKLLTRHDGGGFSIVAAERIAR